MEYKIVATDCNQENVCSQDEPRLNADYKGLQKYLLDRIQEGLLTNNTRSVSVLLAGTLVDEVKLMQTMLFGIFKEIYITTGVRDKESLSFCEWMKTWEVCIDAVSIDTKNLEAIRKGILVERIGVVISGYYEELYYELLDKIPEHDFNSWVHCLHADLLDKEKYSVFGKDRYDAIICVSSLYKMTPVFADEVAYFLKDKGLFLRHTPSMDDQIKGNERDVYSGLIHFETDDSESWVYGKTD